MISQEAREEYLKAVKAGQKEVKECAAAGKPTAPAVLDQLLPDGQGEIYQEIGLVEIPIHRIVGTKSAGRITAFSAGFLPLMDIDTEFGAKWLHLCGAHMSDEGIREPILCYEYLGEFYIQEGNKRLSVLKHFGAARIPGYVRRIMPQPSEEPRVKAYYEFLDFYKDTGLYEVQYRFPGDYAKLLRRMGKEPGQKWTEWDRRNFCAYLQYFREAYASLGGMELDLRPEEALLIWLKVYSFQELGELSGAKLKKAVADIYPEMKNHASNDPLRLQTGADAVTKGGLLGWFKTADHLQVAFIHQLDDTLSAWTRGHEEGRLYVQEKLKHNITTRSYFHADTKEDSRNLLDQAVADGAQVVFTTSPRLTRQTIKAAIRHPKIRFLNCSVNVPYSSVRSYYCRIYEGKFISGAIAGAMANNDRIGYIASYPIYGEPASINAFALGAQMTNPRARIDLRWSCLPGKPVEDFLNLDYQVISNRDVPAPNQSYLHQGEYGIYEVEADKTLTPLASPCWLWGPLYERMLNTMLAGNWNQGTDKALNYWWGIDTGAIDVVLWDKIPESMRYLAEMLRTGFRNGTLDPFCRKIVAQDGTVKNDGTRHFTAEQLLRMDWLCDNVEGFIPEYDDVLPFAQPMLMELGLHKETLPMREENKG